MSSISPLSSNSEAIYPASLTSPATSGSSTNKTPAAIPVDTPQDTVSLSSPGARDIYQMGRVAYNEQAGKITSAQGAQIDSLIQQLQTSVKSETAADGGTLSATDAKSISQMQTRISHEIYADAHGISNGSTQITPPAVPDPAVS